MSRGETTPRHQDAMAGRAHAHDDAGSAASVPELAAAAIAARGGTLLRRIDEDRRLKDPETVHDVRVASRRLREALVVFRAAIPGRSRRRLAESVRSATRRLGEARNADVGAALLRDWLTRAETPGGDAPAWAPAASTLATHLEARARRLRRSSIGFSRGESRALGRRLGRAVDALESGGRARRAARRASTEVARRAITKRVARFFREAPGWTDPANIEALHATRIAAKRLRYALELFEPCGGPGFADRLEHLRSIQEDLGCHHDASVLLDEAAGWEESGALAMRAAGRGAWRALETRLVEERRRWHSRFLERLEGWREETFTAFLLDGFASQGAAVGAPSGARTP